MEAIAKQLVYDYESNNIRVGEKPYNEAKSKLTDVVSLESAKRHVEALHGDNKALVQLFQIVAGEDTPRRHYFFKGDKLAGHVNEWLDNDVYISLNTFKTVSRKTENVVRLNALYTDLDFYKIGMDKQEALARIDEIIANEEAPVPNMIIHSGRGLQLVWLIEFMTASPSYIRLWNRMQQSIYETFKPLNSDLAAKSITQIFRLAGTTNSKNNARVTVEYTKHTRYSISELKEALLEELPSDWKEKRAQRLEQYKQQQGQRKEKQQQAKKQGLTKASLNKARMLDIERLVDMRGGYVERKKTLFYYSVVTMEACGDRSALEYAVEQLSQKFFKLPPASYIDSAIQSAVRSYELARDEHARKQARKNGWNAGYNFTNGYLIESLAITKQEQVLMLTIIDEDEKKARKKEANRQLRRKQGMKTAKEYKDKRAKQKQEQLEQLRKLLAENPKLKGKELAQIMNVTPAWISKLRKQLRQQQKN